MPMTAEISVSGAYLKAMLHRHGIFWSEEEVLSLAGWAWVSATQRWDGVRPFKTFLYATVWGYLKHEIRRLTHTAATVRAWPTHLMCVHRKRRTGRKPHGVVYVLGRRETDDPAARVEVRDEVAWLLGMTTRKRADALRDVHIRGFSTRELAERDGVHISAIQQRLSGGLKDIRAGLAQKSTKNTGLFSSRSSRPQKL